MRVLMTVDTVGGVWSYTTQLAAGLAAHGVEIALLTAGSPLSNSQREQTQRLPNVTVHESADRLEWMTDPWADVARTGDRLLAIERDFKPHVVHLNGYAYAQRAFAAPTLVVGHSDVRGWFDAVRGHAAPAEWDRYTCEVTNGLHAADLVVTPSATMLGDLRRAYGPLPNARVIFNGRDARRYAATDKRDVILAAGRLWDEAKNLATLDAAAAGLSWPVEVAGPAVHPDGGEVETQAARPLGTLDEAALAARMATAAIYALPARYEPFGLSVLEAALSGCALVLGDISSLRELWTDAAVFVPPDDADALRDALRRLIRSPEERRDYAARAQQHARRYSAEAMADYYVLAYGELAAASPVPPAPSPGTPGEGWGEGRPASCDVLRSALTPTLSREYTGEGAGGDA